MYLSPFYVNLILEFSYHPKPPLRDGQFPTPATNRRIIYLFGLKEATIAAPRSQHSAYQGRINTRSYSQADDAPPSSNSQRPTTMTSNPTPLLTITPLKSSGGSSRRADTHAVLTARPLQRSHPRKKSSSRARLSSRRRRPGRPARRTSASCTPARGASCLATARRGTAARASTKRAR